MRRLLFGFACLALLSASVGCQSPCTNCQQGGRAGIGGHAYGKSGMIGQGLHARHGGGNGNGGHMGHHYRPPTEPAGGPAPQYAYPYYTLRGPRDFLVDNPPSIGPY